MDERPSGPPDPEELERFRKSFLYEEPAFLVDEVIALDWQKRGTWAHLDTRRPFAAPQRVPAGHPRHVAAGEILMGSETTGGDPARLAEAE